MSGNYSDDMRKILDMLDGITETDADNKTLLTESDTLEQLEEGPRWDKFKSQVKSKNPFSKAGRTKAKGDLRTRKLAQTWENAWHDHAGSTGTEQTVDDLAAFLQHQVKFVPQAIQQIISTATGHDVALNGNADKNTDNNTQGEKGPESQQSTSAPQSDPNAKGPEDQQSGTTTGTTSSASPTMSTSTSFTHNPGAGANWGQQQDHTVTNNTPNTTNTPAAGNSTTDPNTDTKNTTSDDAGSMDDKQVKTAMINIRSSLAKQDNEEAQKTVVNLHRHFGKISDAMKPAVASALVKAGQELVNAKTVSQDDLNQLKKDLGKYLSQPAPASKSDPSAAPAPKGKPKTTTTAPEPAQNQNKKQKIAASYLNLGNLLKECGDDILGERSEYRTYMFEDDPAPEEEEGQVNGSMPLDNTEVKKIFYAAAQYAVKKGLVGSRNKSTGYNSGSGTGPVGGSGSGGDRTSGGTAPSGGTATKTDQTPPAQQTQQPQQSSSSSIDSVKALAEKETGLKGVDFDGMKRLVADKHIIDIKKPDHKEHLIKIGYAYLKSLR